MIPFGFHVEARKEFRESARYYELQKVGLGSRFVDTVRDAITRIRSHCPPEKLHPAEHMHGHSIRISEMYAQDLSESVCGTIGVNEREAPGRRMAVSPLNLRMISWISMEIGGRPVLLRAFRRQ